MEKYDIKFNEEKHQYEVNGVVVPSVSDIISPLNYALSKVNKKTLEESQILGTEVHTAIDVYLSSGIMLVNEKVKPYFNAFIKFYDDFIKGKYEVVATEYRFYNPILNYCGTIDLLLKDKEWNYVIVDFKTTSSIHIKPVENQLTGYRLGIMSENKVVKKTYACRLCNDESYELKETKFSKAFSLLIKLYDYIKN